MKTVRLEDVAEIQAGYQSRTTVQKCEDGTHLLIQGKDINEDGSISLNSLIRFNPDRNPELYRVYPDDILFQARGSDHNAIIVKKNIPNALATGSFYIIRPNSDLIRPEYLVWWLNQPTAQSFFKSKGGATGISFVSKSVLRQMEISLPSLPVQIKIGKIQQLLYKEQQLNTRLIYLHRILANAVCNKHTH